MKVKFLKKKPSWPKIPRRERKSRKTEVCLNCSTPLNQDFNYCPMCGQENEDHHVSFSRLVHDFFSNYFSFDSKLGRTVYPFFLKPGFLTNQFITGKRASYLHPVRLYLFTSFLYFLIFSFFISTRVALDESANKNIIDIDVSDAGEKDSTEVLSLESIKSSPADDLGERAINLYKAAKFDGALTDMQLLDTLNYEATFLNRLLARQTQRVQHVTPKEFIVFAFGKLPVLMFFVIPVYAFILFLFYIRRKRYYIEHLIFTLHIHSFTFLWFALVLIEQMIYSSSLVSWFAILAISIYSYKSFRNVYKQSRIKTLSKIFLTSLIYFFLLLFVFILGLVISLILI